MKRWCTLLAMLAFGLLGTVGTAFAHNTLIDSDPKDGARIAQGPSQIRLTFDQPVRLDYNTVTLIGPDGGHWIDQKALVEGPNVTVPVRPLGPAGTYTAGYRILSDDGHPVTGKVSFTLTKPGTGTPGAAPEGADQSDSEQGGSAIWPWIGGAVVLVALGVVLALRLGRGTSPR